MATHGNDLNCDDEGGNQTQQSDIIRQILGSYHGKGDVDRILHYLQEAFTSGALVCLICIDNVERNDFVWSCEECFSTFHLDCIQKWAKDSIYLQSQTYNSELESAATSSYQRKSQKSFKWSCPKCRVEYANSKIPREYKCFCGNTFQPKFNPWLIPHSCGEKCNKTLRPECGHSCLLLCHPGPCPPCPVMVRHPCFCQQSTPQMRRCSSKAWSCNAVCGKLLLCKEHKCLDRCHDGPCAICKRTSMQKCRCGAASQIKSCADLDWQCGKVCRKQLYCGYHSCERVCHSGACGKCPLGGDLACPCGKQTYRNLPCTETIPTCGDTCSKPLSCSTHFCAERCHKGPCPSCLQIKVKKCSCGSREKELPCSKNFTCEVKCKRLRDCKKHACNRKCCTGDCPPCEHPCGKTLGCGQHKCESRCHQMRCFPCSLTHKISCSCGSTTITVPCGRERKTPIPTCNLQCKKKPVCHHPKTEPHRCHASPCPSCKFKCGITLKCLHTCPVNCHDAVPVKIISEHKRAGPWEKISSPQVEIRKLPCPPCLVKMPNTCLGTHETTDWICSELRPFSCERKCGRLLDCSHHKCAKECHLVEDAKDVFLQGRNCERCEQMCSQPRPDGCPHRCKLPCHADSCPPCHDKLKMMCHCGLFPLTLDCCVWTSSDAPTREKMQSCTNRCIKEMSCGHRCLKQCHSKECTPSESCRKKVGVRCPCKRIRKDFSCHLVISGKAKLPCDEVCAAKVTERLQAEEAVKLEKKRQEAEAQQKELEEYERFIQGRKRKRKREISHIEKDTNLWWRSKLFLFGFALVFVTVFIFVWSFK